MLLLYLCEYTAILSGALCKAKAINNSPEMNIAEDHTIRLEECRDKTQKCWPPRIADALLEFVWKGTGRLEKQF